VVHVGSGILARDLAGEVAAAEVLARAASNAGVRRIIALSLPGADTEAAEPLRRAKGRVEATFAAAAPPSVVLRVSLLDTPATRDALATGGLGTHVLATPVAPVRVPDLLELVVAFDRARGEASHGHLVVAADGPLRLRLADHLRRLGIDGAGSGRARGPTVHRSGACAAAARGADGRALVDRRPGGAGRMAVRGARTVVPRTGRPVSATAVPAGCRELGRRRSSASTSTAVSSTPARRSRPASTSGSRPSGSPRDPRSSCTRSSARRCSRATRRCWARSRARPRRRRPLHRRVPRGLPRGLADPHHGRPGDPRDARSARPRPDPGGRDLQARCLRHADRRGARAGPRASPPCTVPPWTRCGNRRP
jgi:hypothetical protein